MPAVAAITYPPVGSNIYVATADATADDKRKAYTTLAGDATDVPILLDIIRQNFTAAASRPSGGQLKLSPGTVSIQAPFTGLPNGTQIVGSGNQSTLALVQADSRVFEVIGTNQTSGLAQNMLFGEMAVRRDTSIAGYNTWVKDALFLANAKGIDLWRLAIADFPGASAIWQDDYYSDSFWFDVLVERCSSIGTNAKAAIDLRGSKSNARDLHDIRIQSLTTRNNRDGDIWISGFSATSLAQRIHLKDVTIDRSGATLQGTPAIFQNLSHFSVQNLGLFAETFATGVTTALNRYIYFSSCDSGKVGNMVVSQLAVTGATRKATAHVEFNNVTNTDFDNYACVNSAASQANQPVTASILYSGTCSVLQGVAVGFGMSPTTGAVNPAGASLASGTAGLAFPAGTGGGGTVTINGAAALWCGDSSTPYFMSPARSADQNSTALAKATTDGQHLGLKVVIPAYEATSGINAGKPDKIPVAPTTLTCLGDRYFEISGANGPNATVLKQTKGAANVWTKTFTPDGIASSQDYWLYVINETVDGSPILRNLTLEGGHGTPSAASDPNNAAGQGGWSPYGIGYRAVRRNRMYNCVIGGFQYGAQFDGAYDHTHWESVITSGNWDNVRFGPRQNEKDNVFMSCAFSNSSRSGISIARNGFLAGSSFYGCHFGTQPYGIYIESGTKNSGGFMMQNNQFIESIFEGCGNYKIFCEDGNSRLDRIGASMLSFHGVEVGDHSNIHTYYCASVTSLARDANGLVYIGVTPIGTLPGVGEYISLNGTTGSNPVSSPTVNGVEDKSFGTGTFTGGASDGNGAVYQVVSVAANVITAQGANTTVVALPGTPATATGFVSRVGLIRAGKLTGWRGDWDVNTDELNSRDSSGYGLAAELSIDVNSVNDMDVFDEFFYPNFNGARWTGSWHANPHPAFFRGPGGRSFLAKAAGTIPKKSLVCFSGTSGDVVATTTNVPGVGVVGGTDGFTRPLTPGGTYAVSGDIVWVQDQGFADVNATGTSATNRVAVTDGAATGSVKMLALNAAPGATDFEIGTAIGTVTAGVVTVKLD